MTAVTAQSHAWMIVVMISGLANSYQLLVRIKWTVGSTLTLHTKPLNLVASSFLRRRQWCGN